MRFIQLSILFHQFQCFHLPKFWFILFHFVGLYAFSPFFFCPVFRNFIPKYCHSLSYSVLGLPVSGVISGAHLITFHDMNFGRAVLISQGHLLKQSFSFFVYITGSAAIPFFLQCVCFCCRFILRRSILIFCFLFLNSVKNLVAVSSHHLYMYTGINHICQIQYYGKSPLG